MKLTQMNPEKLVCAKYNPKSRTNEKSLSRLLSSISNYGILYPILIDAKMNVIDGHRRFACAKNLGMSLVPVIISESKIHKDVAYETINTTARKMSGKELIFVYINGGKVSKVAEEKIKTLEALIGTTRLRQLGEKNISPEILKYAELTGRRAGDTSKEFLVKAINWMINTNQMWVMKRAVESEIPANVLKKAVLSNSKLKQSWV